MDDLERRVSILEGRSLAVANILGILANDYQGIRDLLYEKQKHLSDCRRSQAKAVAANKNAVTDYEVAKTALIDEETKPTGKINGSNADARKTQTQALLALEHKPGGRLHDAYVKMYRAENDLLNETTELDIAVDSFSAVRYVAHMISALAESLK